MSASENPYLVKNSDDSGPEWSFNWDMLRDTDTDGGADE